MKGFRISYMLDLRQQFLGVLWILPRTLLSQIETNATPTQALGTSLILSMCLVEAAEHVVFVLAAAVAEPAVPQAVVEEEDAVEEGAEVEDAVVVEGAEVDESDGLQIIIRFTVEVVLYNLT